MSKINNFDEYNKISELFIQEHGNISEESTKLDLFKYKISELGWLKKRFDLYINEVPEENALIYLDELSNNVNDIHRILNNIRNR